MRESIRQILNISFQIILFLFLITLLLQQFYAFEVNSRINVNWFMFAVIVIGALSILFPPLPPKKKETPVTLKDKVLIIFLGILGGVIIFLKLNALGWIGYVISVLGGLIIILLSWLVLTEKDED